MKTVTPVEVQTPDGVNRVLRFTLGARKRIQDKFGMPFKEALDKFSEGAFPSILFALMHDVNGNPPTDITEAQLGEMLSPEDTPEILAAILSAAMQGKKSKNEIEPMIREKMEAALALIMNGSTDGALPHPTEALDSPISSSGGASSNVN